MKASDPNAAQTKRVPAQSPKQAPTRETLALETLVTDTGTQMRSEISEQIVAEYAEALGDGARFPPVVIFRSNDGDILADGFHRVRAYKDAHRYEIEADVYQGDQKEAIWFALGANRAHGQRLTGYDKQRAIEIAYKAWPNLSQSLIAAQVGCTQGYVGRIRAQLKGNQLPERSVGRDGRTRPATRKAKSRKASTTPPESPPTTTETHRAVTPVNAENSANAQEKSATPSEASRPDPKLPEQTDTEPGKDSSTQTEPARRRAEATGTGVTAKQSAQDRLNRIVSVVVEDAKNLTAQEHLIDFTALDRTQLPKWIDDLKDARRQMRQFIRRLRLTIKKERR